MVRVEVQEVGVWKKVNPCLDHEGRRRVRVGTRYQVVLLVCEGMVSDGMWVRLTHAARIASKEKAERLAEAVRKAIRQAKADWDRHCSTAGITAPLPAHMRRDDGQPKWSGLDLRQWIWSPGPANAFADLQKVPTAIEYDVD